MNAKSPHLFLLCLALTLPALGAPVSQTPQTPHQAPSPDWLARAQDLERRSDWPRLLDWGLRWTQAEADNALAWFVLGRAYKALGRHPEAILAYRQNLRLAPGDVHAQTNLGNVYRDSRRFPEALNAYRQAVRVNPSYLPAWRNFGQTFYVYKGQAGVIAAVQRVERVNPGLARAWFSLMVAFYRDRDDAAGREALALLRGLEPEQVDRLFALILDQTG